MRASTLVPCQGFVGAGGNKQPENLRQPSYLYIFFYEQFMRLNRKLSNNKQQKKQLSSSSIYTEIHRKSPS